MTDAVALPTDGALTPSRVSELMELAIREGGPDAVSALERLVGLAERVTDRQASMAFNAAYAAFREAMPSTVTKTKKAVVPSRSGAEWSWWYTPIEHIMQLAEPHLRKQGLYVSWTQDEAAGEDAATTVACTLHHAAGHSRTARVTIRKGSSNPKLSPGQKDAGTLTTAMRRALAMVLGIVDSSPEDPDAELPGETVTPEQEADLNVLCEQLAKPKAARTSLCRAFRSESLSQIPQAAFDGAKARLLELAAKERKA